MLAAPLIPYFQAPDLQLGPLPVHPFGLFAAGGILLAATLIAREARRAGHDDQPLRDFSLWAVIGGVIGAHLVHLLGYHPEELRENGPLQLFRVWDGLSSTGGVLGGVVAAALFFKRRHIPFSRYADSLALGVAPGWAVARLGCFAIHDHPGVPSDFFLAVRFPQGARHDLGLDDALVLFALTALLYALSRRRLLEGRLLGVLALVYGLCRFGLDFLRARDLTYSDARYLGLTPAQYACFALVAYGAYQLTRARPLPARPAA